MAKYKIVDLAAQPYIYHERSCSMDPNDISKNMGIAFEAVGELIGGKGVTSAGRPLSVYFSMDPEIMNFRAGFLVSAEDAKKAEGDVKADVLPSGKALNFIHYGPYAKLRDSYDEMMNYAVENDMQIGVPTWEVYLNEPSDVASEDALMTDIYVTLEGN